MLSLDQKWRKKRRKGNWWVPHLYKACAAFACFLSESFLEVCVLILKFTVKSVMAEVIKTELGGEVCPDCTVRAQSKPGSRGAIFLQILYATENATWSPNPPSPLPKCALRLYLPVSLAVHCDHLRSFSNRTWAEAMWPMQNPYMESVMLFSPVKWLEWTQLPGNVWEPCAGESRAEWQEARSVSQHLEANQEDRVGLLHD